MSNVVDSRVVEMRFDNRNFESNVKTSLSTLERLKQALKLPDSSKSLEKVAEATKRVDFSEMGRGIQTVQARFSAMEVVALSALSNITNSLISTGRQFISTFTTRPISDGFSEYELKMGSVQTIMASTGATLEEVNQYLEELNTYADKTIYSFSDMTASIGKFTNAGVDLDKAVAAIKGISNEAALSGANANEASRAMYNFAQALSAGHVKLIDWKSIENANMATKEFKQELIDTAVEMGTVQKKADGMYQSITGTGQGGDDPFNATKMFNDSLSSQWMTTEVLIETLNRYADETTNVGKRATAAAQDVKTFTQLMDTLKEAAGSGWAQTWEIMIGDFNEAKSHFTKLSKIFGGAIDQMSDSRNTLLKGAMKSNWSIFADQLQEAGISVEELDTAVRTFAKEGLNDFEYARSGFANTEKSLKDLVQEGTVGTDLLRKSLDSLISTSKDLSNVEIGMQIGANGEAVKNLQQALMNAGFALDKFGVDGIFLSETQAVLKAFQEANGLESTGIVDEATLEVLKKSNQEITNMDELLSGINKLGGQDLLWNSLFNSIEAVSRVLKSVKKAWSEVFDPVTSDQINKIIDQFHTFTEKLKPTRKQMNQITTTFKGLFSVLDLVGRSARGVASVGITTFRNILKRLNLDIFGTSSSIGKLLTGFRDWVIENKFIEKAVESANKAIDKGLNKLETWIRKFKELPIVKNNIEKFKMAFQNFSFDKFGDHLQDIGNRLERFIIRLKNMDGISIDNIKFALKDFKDNVLNSFFNFEGFDGFQKAFENLGKDIEKLLSDLGIDFDKTKEKIKTFFENFKNGDFNIDFKSVFETLIEKIKKFGTDFTGHIPGIGTAIDFLKTKLDEFGVSVQKIVDRIPLGKIIAIMTALSIIFGMTKLGSLVMNILHPIESFKEILSDFTESISQSLGKLAKAKQMEAMAKSILMLAAALAVIANIPRERLLPSVAALGGLMIALGALVGVLGVLNKFGAKIGEVAKSLFALAIALGVMIGAVIILGALPLPMVAQGIVAIIAMLLTLIGTIFLLSKIQGEMPKISKTLIALGIAMLGLSVAIRILAGMNLGEAFIGVGSMVIAIGALVGMLALIKLIKPTSTAGLLSLTAAILILSISLKMLSTVKYEGLLSNLKTLGIVLGMLFAITKLSKKIGNGGGSLMAMSISLLLLVAAVKMLGSMDPQVAAKGIVFMTAMIALVTIMTLFNRLINKISISSSGGGVATMIAMATSLVILSAALVLLGQIDSGRLAGATACLVVVMAAMALLMTTLSTVMTASANAKGTIGTLVVLTAAIAAIGILITALSAIPFTDLLGAAVALTVGMAALVIALNSISKVQKVSLSALIALAVLTAVTAAVGMIISSIATLGAENALASATALAEVLGAITAVAYAASVIGKTPIGAIGQGLVAISAVGALITAIIGLIGCFNSLTDGAIADAFQNAVPVMLAIGESIGALVGGFGAGLTDGLPKIGENLKAFGTHMTGFLDAMQGYDGGAAEAIGAIAAAIIALAADDFISGITGLLEKVGIFDDSKTLIDKMTEFGSAVSAYGNAVTDLDEGTIKKITDSMTAVKTIIDASNELNGTGGLLQDFLGEQDLGDFGTKLGEFVDGFSKFMSSTSVTEFDGDKAKTISKLMKSVKKIIDTTKELDFTGGWLQELTGTKDLGNFSQTLGTFAQNMVTFLDTEGLEKFDDESAITRVENVMKAAASIITTADLYKPEGNKITDWFTNSGIDNLAGSLGTFAKGISDFSIGIKDVSDDDIEAMNSSIRAIGTLIRSANGIEIGSGGLFSGNDLEEFAGALKPLADGVQSYSNVLKDVTDLDDINTKTEKIGTLIGSITGALAGDGTTDRFVETGSLITFGSELSAFATSVRNAFKTLNKINPEDMDTTAITSIGTAIKDAFSEFDIATLSDAIQTIATGISTMLKTSIETEVTNLKSIGGTIMTNIAAGITEKKDLLNNAVQEAAKSIKPVETATEEVKVDGTGQGKQITSDIASGMNGRDVTSKMTAIMSATLRVVSGKASSFQSTGALLMTSLSNGLKAMNSVIYGAVSSAVSSGVSGASAHYSSFWNTGSFLGAGLVAGLRSKLADAYSAGSEVASSAKRGADDKAGVSSPAKEWIKSARWMGEGLVVGLKSYRDKVHAAGGVLAEAAHETLSDTLGMVANMDFNAEVQPTIRPVLDLSDVEAGVGRLGGFFGVQTVSLQGNISAINQSMSVRRNPNNEVVDMLRGLRSDISQGSSGNTYIINGVTYDDGTNIARAAEALYQEARIQRRA